MKHISTFEHYTDKYHDLYKNDNPTHLYRIIVKDTMDMNGAMHGVIVSLKTRSDKTQEEVKTEFENSDYFLKLIKNKHLDRYIVVVEPLDEGFATVDTVNIKDIRYKK